MKLPFGSLTSVTGSESGPGAEQADNAVFASADHRINLGSIAQNRGRDSVRID